MLFNIRGIAQLIPCCTFLSHCIPINHAAMATSGTMHNGVGKRPSSSGRAPPTSTAGHTPTPSDPDASSGDYTRHIRYPNNSGILVQPLEDDDVAVLQSLMDEGRTKSPPRYVDQTLLLPVPADKEGTGETAQGHGQQVKDNSKKARRK